MGIRRDASLRQLPTRRGKGVHAQGRDLRMIRGRPATLSADEQYCQELTRREAANFYWGFVALPRPQRSAIYALYSFARQVDDDVDLSGAVGAQSAPSGG